MLRALGIGNEDRNNRFTCLGTAITYNRRCRMPLHMWIEVLVEVMEAAEDRSVRLADLRNKANCLGSRLSCYHHVAQPGPGMIALGAIALYRDKFNHGCGKVSWGPYSGKPRGDSSVVTDCVAKDEKAAGATVPFKQSAQSVQVVLGKQEKAKKKSVLQNMTTMVLGLLGLNESQQHDLVCCSTYEKLRAEGLGLQTERACGANA